MNRYFTVMLIPEREKGVRSFRIPRIVLHAAMFLVVVIIFILGILGYDYAKIVKQIYQNKHLSIENRQLKEQIQLFQMKINTLSEDIDRIKTFENKLRIITGAEKYDTTRSMEPVAGQESKRSRKSEEVHPPIPTSSIFNKINNDTLIEQEGEFKELKSLYEKKIATSFGLHSGYTYTKDWFELTKKSFSLAYQFAKFDYRYKTVKNYVDELEVDIHRLDQYLLEKDSMLRSTPTLIPTRGWITSYFGMRKSPYSGRLKMHEGIDVGGKRGAPIVAPADGIVTFVGRKPGFGVLVQLDHGYGVESIYAHTKIAMVKKGQTVRRGLMIAKVGNTGYSTGPHLHYEIRVNGTPVDPLYYILD
ncbi:MAG: M23 family metallopeptidase [Bacteriovoracaceae bacterium]|nr:M23 family metallopeptidase [Bacteriovoracaceae bacterium]